MDEAYAQAYGDDQASNRSCSSTPQSSSMSKGGLSQSSTPRTTAVSKSVSFADDSMNDSFEASRHDKEAPGISKGERQGLVYDKIYHGVVKYNTQTVHVI